MIYNSNNILSVNFIVIPYTKSSVDVGSTFCNANSQEFWNGYSVTKIYRNFEMHSLVLSLLHQIIGLA